LIESVYGLGYRLNLEYACAAIAQARNAEAASLLIITAESSRAEKLQSALSDWRSTPMGLIQPTELTMHLNAIQPHLLILDLTQGNTAGLELCRTIRQSKTWDWLPIIALGRHDDPQLRSQAYAIGCDDFLEQPIPVSELHSRVRNRLDRVNALRLQFTSKASDRA
jgi:two-component system, cell cycle response regulator